MLMSLFSLAGWSAEISEADITIGDVIYGAPSALDPFVVWKGETLKKDQHYTLDANVYKVAACTVIAAPANDIDELPVATYYRKITGVPGEGFTDWTAASFKVTKKEVTVDLNGGALSKTYGDSDPALTADMINWTTVAGLINGATKDVFTLTKLSYTHEGVNYSATPYPVKVEGATADNYFLTINGGITINKKTFNATNITVTVTNNEVTYDGKAQAATIVVADKALGALTVDKDYTVAYSGNTDVNSYTITVTGAGNYDGAIIPTEKLVIGKATILATPKATKVYDGTKDLPAVAKGLFEYSGFVGDGKGAGDIVPNGTTWVSDDADKNVGSGYTVKVTKNELEVDGSSNYQVITQPGTFEITKNTLEIYANPQEVEYGADIDPADMTVSDPGTALANADLWYKKDGKGVETGDKMNILKAVIVYVEGGKLKVKANDAAAAADKKVLANYNVAYNTKAGAEQFGTLTNTKANITIALNPAKVKLTKEYDGQPAAITEDVTDESNLTIVGAPVGTDKLDLSGLKATVVDNTGAVNAGYKVTLTGATVSANADKYTINYVTTYYEVTKKPLTVTINTQSMKVGDKIEDVFKTDFFTVKGLVEPDTKDGIFKLVLDGGLDDGFGNIKAAAETGAWITVAEKTAKAADNYSGWDAVQGWVVIVPNAAIVLNRPAKAAYEADNTLDDADAVIKAADATTYATDGDANTFNASLLGAVAAGDKAPANYKAKVGTNPVDPNNLSADEANAYNATLEGAVKKGDRIKYTVTFSDFPMIAEKWYPIVLPFATSAREVSATFGYAIVNILNEDNTDDTKIAFKLHMGKIPANTPFVVKVDEDMNMTDAIFGLIPDTQKAIEYSAAPEVTDASGVKFIGSYSAKTDGFKANEAFFSVSAAKNDYYWGSDKNKTYMAPLAAYFQIPAGSPARTIIFEEADGSTTAIEAVTSFNAAAKNVEGWYTLNGMKLETAPTQKGIYIKDGKKVVLK